LIDVDVSFVSIIEKGVKTTAPHLTAEDVLDPPRQDLSKTSLIVRKDPWEHHQPRLDFSPNFAHAKFQNKALSN
jgi:hypothetical protein